MTSFLTANKVIMNKTLTKGILGIKKDPKQPILFGFGSEMWPSDDSEDSDFKLEEEQEREWVNEKGIKSTSYPDLLNKSRASLFPLVKSYEYINSDKNYNQTENTSCQPTNSENIKKVKFSLLLPDIPLNNNDQMNNYSHKSKKIKKKKKKLIEKEEKHTKKKKKKYDDLLFDQKKKKKKHKKSKRKEMEITIASISQKNTNVDCEGLWGCNIPEEILVKIFSYIVIMDGAIPFLPRMSKVCRLWYRVAQYPCLWEVVDVSWGKTNLSELQFINLCSEKLSLTKELNLSGWGGSLTQKSIEAVVEHCHHLSSINLSRCIKISSDCVRLIVDKCPKLSVIDLSGTCKRHSSSTSPVSPASVRHLVTNCGKYLAQLYIAENDVAGFTSIIKSISESCPNLQVLDVSNLTSGSRSAVLPVEDFQQGCPRLRVLRLANSNITLAITSLFKQAHSPGFPELEELSIAVESGGGLSDNDVERLLKKSHKLQLLDVRGCKNISISGLVRIPAWDIQHLYLSQCSVIRKVDLELVLQKWSHSIKEVDLSWAVNEEAINQGVMALTMTEQKCPLNILNLCGSAVSYLTIKILLSKCINLHTLNLQSCRSLPRGMKRLYKKDDLIHLRDLINNGQFDESISSTET